MWTLQQQAVVAVLPKISSFLSFFGSGWIALEVLTHPGMDIDGTDGGTGVLIGSRGGGGGGGGANTNNHNNSGSNNFRYRSRQYNRTGGGKKRNHPYHRLLFAMCVYDIFESTFNFMSTWPVPASSTTNRIWAIGTTHFCSTQGFFLQLAVAVPIYNAFLAVYYMLVIYYKFTEHTLLNRVEPTMHCIATIMAFGTALPMVCMGYMNDANLWCWIAPYPTGCKDSLTFGYPPENDFPCTRGDLSWIFRWSFYFTPLWASILIATISNWLIYRTVRDADLRSLQYRIPEIQFNNAATNTTTNNNNNNNNPNTNSFHGRSAVSVSALSQQYIDISRMEEEEDEILAGVRDDDEHDDVRNKHDHDEHDKHDDDEHDETNGNETKKRQPQQDQIDTDEDLMNPQRQQEQERKFHSDLFDSNSSFLAVENDRQPQHGQRQTTTTTTTARRYPQSYLQQQQNQDQRQQYQEPKNQPRYHHIVRGWLERKRSKRKLSPRSVEVARQAFFYLIVFYWTHVWSTTNRIYQQVTHGKGIFALTVVHSFFDPLQGTLNFLVYQRPRYLIIRRKHPHLGRWGALKAVVQLSYFKSRQIKQHQARLLSIQGQMAIREQYRSTTTTNDHHTNSNDHDDINDNNNHHEHDHHHHHDLEMIELTSSLDPTATDGGCTTTTATTSTSFGTAVTKDLRRSSNFMKGTFPSSHRTGTSSSLHGSLQSQTTGSTVIHNQIMDDGKDDGVNDNNHGNDDDPKKDNDNNDNKNNSVEKNRVRFLSPKEEEDAIPKEDMDQQQQQ